MKIGFVVNPIAGMGGRVGLKGTDGKLEEALDRGAEPRAPDRAVEALSTLGRRRSDVRLLAAGGPMGEQQATEAGFDPAVVYRPPVDDWTETGAADTRAAVEAFLDRGVDLVIFVGGDGTAVDVADVLEAHADEGDDQPPILGVPAGVKVYSSVFAVTPAEAGRIAAEFDRVENREVNDIDEEAYREGTVRAELRAVVPVPVSPGVQSSKQVTGGSVASLAAGFAREIDPETLYVFGPGSTVGAIEEELGIEPSPLGVDVWYDGEVLARDAAEADILAAIETVESRLKSDPEAATTDTDSEPPVTIVVSPIGGQGFVFGRGNHQISPAVIERATDVVVVASEAKLDELDALHVDTDDPEIDEELRGWLRVRTGRFTTRMIEVQ